MAGNQVVEWYTSYTIGEGGAVQAHRWSDFSVAPSLAGYRDAFVRNNEAVLGTLDTNQAWSSDVDANGNALALGLSGNEAVQTNASGLGHSWVDVGTPWGALEVTVGTMGTGQTAAYPLIDFESFTIRDDGSLYVDPVRYWAQASAYGRAFVSGDKIRIESFPTRYLPTSYYPTGYDPADAVSQPYAYVLSLNGAWVRTVLSRFGPRNKCGLYGRTGQHFRNFTWTPNTFAALPGPVIPLLPFATGLGTWAPDRLTWTDRNRFVWVVGNGSWGTAASGSTVYASANASVAVVDTGWWYGAMSAMVTNVATGADGNKHGYILCLDYDNRVYLDYQGNIVRDGISYGNVVPAGISSGNYISVQFLDTKQVPTSIRGTIDPAAYPRMILVRVNNVITGILASDFVQAWTRGGAACCRPTAGSSGARTTAAVAPAPRRPSS